MLSKVDAVAQMSWNVAGVIGPAESGNVFFVIGDPIYQLMSA